MTPRARRRVVLLFGHLHQGGMEKVASELSQALPGRFEQVLAYFGTDAPSFAYRAELVDLGRRGHPERGVMGQILNTLLRWVSLQVFILRRGVDTIASFGEIANVLNALTWGKRTVLSVHAPIDRSFPRSSWYGRVYRVAIRLLYPRADVVVAVSEGIRASLEEDYGVPPEILKVIYNSCDQDKIRRLAKVPINGASPDVLRWPSVVSVGSLEHLRGYDMLLRALALARQQVPTLRLVLVGEGTLRAALETLSGDLGLAEAVYFAGFQPNPYQYVSRATMFVSSARYEGFGLAILEAMACGVPVIATDCSCGPREILGDSRYGVLVADPECCDARVVEAELAREMVAFASPGPLREKFVKKGTARLQDFTLSSQVANWVKIL